MVEKQADSGIVDEAYDETLLKCMDLTERHDFYGIVALRGLQFFGEKLGLTPDSRILELCSGIGGPLRFLAKTYGCKATGIDLSQFNHRTAEKRTKEAGLDHLVNFLHGNALEIRLPDESFTHIFGCEGWCYFHDKVRLYKTAYRALKPGGQIAFLEAACDSPVQLRTAELLGDVKYESIADYTSMLETAGFEMVRKYDTTELAYKDVASGLYRLIAKRDRIIESAGEEVYFGLLEVWSEFLAYFSEGRLTHCGFIAQKKGA